jgi:molecular chaperone GrpE
VTQSETDSLISGLEKEDLASGTDLKANGDSSEELKAPLLQRIEELEAQVKEKEAKYMYLYADFDNFKKRTVKERSDLIKFGWESVARELLDVADNLSLALLHMPENTEKSLADGIRMVFQHFIMTLEKQGIKKIATSQQIFDPNLHEALSSEVSDLPEGTIIKEQASGYVLHGRLLRPAKVIISQGNKNEK